MISVIVPVYNSERYLIDTLESLRRQTYSEFEAIIIDDGSTDASGEIVDKYETLDELEKYDYSGNIFMVKEFQARLETFLSLLEKRTSKSGLEDLFEQIELYFYKIDLNLPRVFEEISAATSENKKGLK